jgi:iron complex outermembrane receptor protein
MRDVFKRQFRTWAVVVSLAAGVGSIGSIAVRAQGPSAAPALKGGVIDPHGGAVTTAVVVVRNDVSGFSGTYSTDAAGHFSIDALPPGVYSIEVVAPGFATLRKVGVKIVANHAEDVTFTLSVSQVNEQVTVQETIPQSVKDAPSTNTLAARSAQSVISDEFIRNDTSPVADYSQLLLMAPGTFSVQPNGVGLGDTKTFFRGFKDGQYSMTFDGIPFNDTNDPTHHSWAFFPSQFVGGTVFDRSPGSAASIGPSTFGGSVNLLSRSLDAQPHAAVTGSYGSFGTQLVDGEFDSGAFGGGSNRLLVEGHQLKSDGYQTFNRQQRDAFSAKYEHDFANETVLTAFTGIIELTSNTPNTKGPTRAQVAANGNNYLLSGNPADANYFGYNFYDVPTDFDYVGLKTNLGHGWSFDDKAYTLRYYNKQNYNSATAISATSATDKLNSYRKYGNLLPVTNTSSLGVLRTGLWSEYAMTDRFQTPSDPRTWVDAALPNFHEKFNTTSLQPYAEFEWAATTRLHVTPGVKLAYFQQDFTQFADNGKTVGNLNGAPSIEHTATYHSWLPSLDGHYLVQHNWSIYAQYAGGTNVPPTSTFDVKNAAVSVLPKPTLTTTYEAGTVWQSERASFGMDTYRINFDNDYSSTTDANGETQYFSAGSSTTKGVEAEGNVRVAGGLTVYANGTVGSATYNATGLHVQNAPGNTETIGLNYREGSWNVGWFTKRVGQMFNDNGATHEAVSVAPFAVTNLYVNFMLKNGSHFTRTKVQFSVQNLFNNQSIVGVSPATTTTSVASPNDILTIMPRRAVSLTLVVDFGKS